MTPDQQPQVLEVQQPQPAKKKSSGVESILILSVVLVILIVQLVALLATGVPVRQRSERWEYKGGFAYDQNLESAFDPLGRDGWEVTYCRRAHDGKTPPKYGYECLFKRRITED